MSEENNAKVCPSCNATSFYLDLGFYFCTQCCTQYEDAREAVHERQYDATTRAHKITIKKQKTEKDIVGWTSWELYNLVLVGVVNELIEIGVDPEIKVTVLQLWSYYLKTLEVAFTSRKKKLIPKMARRYHKRDAEIIYGRVQKKKRDRRKSTSNTSISSAMNTSTGSGSKKDLNKSQKLLIAAHNESIRSQQSSDMDANSSLNQSLLSLKSSISNNSSTKVKIRFNKKARLEKKKVKEMAKKLPCSKRKLYKQRHVSTQYVTGPDVLTPLKLWSIIYLALRIHNQTVYASDMLRFGREGHLTYYKLDNLIPSEASLTKADITFLSQSIDITHKGLRRTAARLANCLEVNELPKPDILGLINRYCEDLELPRGIMLYAKRLYWTLPSVMDFSKKSSLIPNYEGRAMAYIIVVLKVLFSLDDVTEKDISRVISKINRLGSKEDVLASKLFDFCEWQMFVECRQFILGNMHFPSKAKYAPEIPGVSHLYLRFMGLLKSKREAEFTNPILPQETLDLLYSTINKLVEASTQPLKEMEVFPPSLTPLKSYVASLNENSHYDVPYELKTNFYDMKIGYITRPDSLIELAAYCGINLEVIDSSIQYMEKIVPAFELPNMPEAKELCEKVEIETASFSSKKKKYIDKRSEICLDYSHKNRVSKMKVKKDCFEHYMKVCKKMTEFDESLNFEEESECILTDDGRLNINDNSDSEEEDTTLNQSNLDTSDSCNYENLESEEFFNNRKFKLYKHELKSLYNTEEHTLFDKTVKKVLHRDKKGKFIKASDVKAKKSYKRIVKVEESQDSNEDEVVDKAAKVRKRRSKKNSQDGVKDEVIDVSEESESEISIMHEDVTIVNDTTLENLSINDQDVLLRPYDDYWMYHCNFSRVKGKDFELFEKELPKNFQWLLNICADIVEMPTEDLYEEVCLIEAYHFNLMKSKKGKKSKEDDDYVFQDTSSKSYFANILSKW